MEIKEFKLKASNVASGSNTMLDSGFRNMISLWHRHHDANEVHVSDLGDTAHAENTISMEGIKTDGNLVLTTSWADGGFSVYRLEDAGTLTHLYNDRYPHAGSNDYQSIALDKVNKIAWVGSYQISGLSSYDYSDPDNVVKLGTIYTADGLPGDEFGHSYTNGLGAAGEYIYMGIDDRSNYEANRIHSLTGVIDSVAIQNTSGGADYNRYAAVYYSPETDRIYLHSYYDGELDIVTDASTAGAKAYSIQYDDLSGIDNDGYIHMVIEDTSNRNHLWVGSGYQTFKIDVTPCIVDGVASGVKPILLSDVKHRETDHKTYTNMRLSAPTPDQGDFIINMGERGWNRQGGWLDQENHNVVSVSRQGSDTWRSRDYLYFDYQASPRLVTTTGGTKYWILGGYGWDGHKLRVYNETEAIYLETAGNIEFDPVSLDNTNDIGSVLVPELENSLFTPSGTTAIVEVTNNGGTTWEVYTPGTTHVFTSTGNSFKIKISFTGNGIASGYVLSQSILYCLLLEDFDYQKNIRHVNTKIRGGR